MCIAGVIRLRCRQSNNGCPFYMKLTTLLALLWITMMIYMVLDKVVLK